MSTASFPSALLPLEFTARGLTILAMEQWVLCTVLATQGQWKDAAAGMAESPLGITKKDDTHCLYTDIHSFLPDRIVQ